MISDDKIRERITEIYLSEFPSMHELNDAEEVAILVRMERTSVLNHLISAEGKFTPEDITWIDEPCSKYYN